MTIGAEGSRMETAARQAQQPYGDLFPAVNVYWLNDSNN